jgi:hypothetical protein
MKVEGKSADTQLRHALRQMRGAYIENVKAGRCKMDKRALAAFDVELEKLNGSQAHPTKHK